MIMQKNRFGSEKRPRKVRFPGPGDVRKRRFLVTRYRNRLNGRLENTSKPPPRMIQAGTLTYNFEQVVNNVPFVLAQGCNELIM